MASQSTTATRPTATLAAAPPTSARPLAIYYIHPLLAGPLQGWPALLDRVAAAGFSHIMLAPPFHAASVLLPDDFTGMHAALGWSGDGTAALAFLDAACRERELGWLLDVVLDRVAPEGAIAQSRPDLFAKPARAIDPRQPELVARPRFHEQNDALATWWHAQLGVWLQAGAAGFRLLGLAETPPAFVRDLATAAHRRRPGCRMIGWTADLPSENLARWIDSGLDATCLALENWDWHSDRLWTQAAAMERVAPVIVCAEAPFGRRIAARLRDPDQRAVAARRAVATAAAMAAGYLVPMGLAELATRRMDPRRTGTLPTSDTIDLPSGSGAGDGKLASPVVGDATLKLLRRSHTARSLTVVNLSLTRPVATEAPSDHQPMLLPPGGVRTFVLQRESPVLLPRETAPATVAAVARSGRIAVEAVSPVVDDGRFAAKRTVGEPVAVTCDVICEGHDQLGVVLQWRAGDRDAWQEAPMLPQGNDLWQARLVPERIGRWLFRIVAWRDAFATFRDELAKKSAAGVDTRLEVLEGRALLEQAQTAKSSLAGPEVASALAAVKGSDRDAQVAALLSPATAAAMQRADARPFATVTGAYPLEVDRKEAEFAAWYEIFPRSMSDDETRHGTFRDVIRHLPRIRDMGFDILYFPPIHPIGRKNRKGRNNSLTPTEDDPGSPYAIGSEAGGHDAIHPELGTMEDFQALRAAASEHGLELALDFAIQCSPDHPWLRQHKDWFAWRPDGSIRYAENPPKKYEDIVNVDFYGPGAVPGLWVALRDAVAFWAEQGVRVFRVDNPHTKPFPFWEWLIGDIRAAYPDALFLAEAFTRPKVMNRLGKVGFTQSYTYFTWRNTRRELEAYSTLLATGPERDFFRPNFFVNTPDINPVFLQTSGRPGFLIRAALAATLAGSWGVYCGFELCEGTPLPGREEYLDSEKYQLRAWDWDQPGNIVAEISRLNQLRRRNPALQTHLGVTFLASDNDQVMFFEKATADRSNVVLVAISLDPARPQSAAVELPLYRWALPDGASLACDDLVQDIAFTLTGKYQRVALTPDAPYTLWRARSAT